ncbi:MAG: CoB--CoM heterodisulfide reductase iron-sulfur subunit B family protein [Candidatus Bathyarchaeia archaeon]
MKYAYFPGCSIKSTAREYGVSCKAISKVLDIELVEIPDWNCCGAMDTVYAYDPVLSLSLSARNMALAETMKMDIVTLCSACYFTLSRANKLLHENQELKEKVDKKLHDAGLKYVGDVKVRHYLDILVNDIGFDEIGSHVKTPLDGLKVASYYGCMLVRPPDIVSFDNPEHPQSMDKLVEVLGGKAANYIDKVRCCGASLGLTEEEVMMNMTKELLVSAKNANAECIIVPCPMCHFNLDAKQKDIESTFDLKFRIPVLYFTQLMGIAFGLDPKNLALNKNFVSPSALLRPCTI